MIHNKVRGFTYPEFYQLVVGNIWGEEPLAVAEDEPQISFQDMDLIIKTTPLETNLGSFFRDMVLQMVDENTYDLTPFAFPYTTAPITFYLFDSTKRTKTVFFNDVQLFKFDGAFDFEFKIFPQLYPAKNKVYVTTESGLSSRVFSFAAYNTHTLLGLAANKILDQRVDVESTRHNLILTPGTIINDRGE